jgi:electron transfer flavoprotein beta subunit
MRGNTDSDSAADEACQHLKERGLLITEWNAHDLNLLPEQCGRSGSPTWVKKIERVVLTSTQHKTYPPSDAGMCQLMQELMEDHTFG